LRIPVYATDFGRYLFAPEAKERVIFPYFVNRDNSTLISEKEFKARFPRTFDYLRSRKTALDNRQQFSHWHGFSAPRNLAAHDSAHLLVPLLADRGLFSEFPQGRERFCLMASGGFSITLGHDAGISPLYVLGLCNSRLLFAYLRSISNIFRGGWITCTKQYVTRLPIRTIDFSDPADKGRHGRMVALVERMLELNRRWGGSRTAQGASRRAPSVAAMSAPPPVAGETPALQLDREIARTDAEIDELVYELYGITDEERKIIEGG
jgi:hypothetical protein